MTEQRSASTIVRPPGPARDGVMTDRHAHVEAPWEFFRQLQQTYGDLVYFKLGLQDVYLVSDPEMIRDVLVTNDRKFARGAGLNRGYSRLVGQGVLMTAEGERYRRQRRLVLPSLHVKRLNTYASIMVGHALRVAETFEEGVVRDIHAVNLQLALAVVINSLFGADLPEPTLLEISEQVRLVLEVFNRKSSRTAALEGQRTKDALARLNEVVLGLVRARREDPADHGDLLSMLLVAHDDEGDGTGMTDEEIRGEILSLIVAGHETVSSGLSWSWYSLSQTPDAEARLHAELDEVLQGEPPQAEHFSRLPYLTKVVSESLRLFPPSSLGVDRVVLEDHELGGYFIPAGSTIVMSQFVVQRDPRWYPEPERFDPERWAPGQQDLRPQFSYFPFSGGLRTCVGYGFAVMEITLVLAAMASRWRFELEPGHPIEIDARIAIKPKHGLRVVPHRRQTGGPAGP
jgi:cytochrome P450